MQDTRRIGFRRPEVPRHDGRKGLPFEELPEQVRHRGIKVAGADPLGHGSGLEVVHQREEARLRRLGGHGFGLDGADLLERRFLLGGGERVDVVEDVNTFGYGEGGAHLAEHIVLGYAGGSVRGFRPIVE